MFLRGEEERPNQLDFLHIGFVSRSFAVFIHGADAFIGWLSSSYAKSIHVALRLRYILILIFVAGLGGNRLNVPDRADGIYSARGPGYLFCIIQAPPGASLEYTSAVADQAQAIIASNKDTMGTFSVMGFSFSGAASNQGMIFVNLKPSDDRRGDAHSAAAIVADLTPKLQMLMMSPHGAYVGLFQPPAVNGVGAYGGFQFVLEDHGQNTLGDMDRVAHQIVGASRAPDSHLSGLLTTFSANDPQVLVNIDREKLKAMNVSLGQITDTLGVFLGSEYVNDFDFNNRTYRVYVQADKPFRMNTGQLRSFYVRSDTGSMVPLENLVTVHESAGASVISHYNLFRSVEIDGSPAVGYSSGQGVASMQALADKIKMPGMGYEWTGLTLEELESGGKAMLIFGLGLLVVYLTLSAQYESFVLPFIILLAVPMAVLGALGAVQLRHLLGDPNISNDVYCQIGLVHRSTFGEKLDSHCGVCRTVAQEGAVDSGCGDRSCGTEVAADPYDVGCVYFGCDTAGFCDRCWRAGQDSVGTTIVGGMLLSTVLNLYFIPVLYVLVQSLMHHGHTNAEPTPVAE